jgi:hypothetical protein
MQIIFRFTFGCRYSIMSLSVKKPSEVRRATEGSQVPSKTTLTSSLQFNDVVVIATRQRCKWFVLYMVSKLNPPIILNFGRLMKYTERKSYYTSSMVHSLLPAFNSISN